MSGRVRGLTPPGDDGLLGALHRLGEALEGSDGDAAEARRDGNLERPGDLSLTAAAGTGVVVEGAAVIDPVSLIAAVLRAFTPLRVIRRATPTSRSFGG